MNSTADDLGQSRQLEQADRSAKRLMGEEDIEVDQDARDDAKDALNKITSHEQLCTERWQQSREASARIEKALADMNKALSERIGKVPATIITAMAAVIGFLGAHVHF
jgi:hypothetical protein